MQTENKETRNHSLQHHTPDTDMTINITTTTTATAAITAASNTTTTTTTM